MRLTLRKILILAETEKNTQRLRLALDRLGFICTNFGSSGNTNEAVIGTDIGVVLVDMNGSASLKWIELICKQLSEIKLKRQMPVVAIFSKGTFDKLCTDLSIDDFVVEPRDLSELAARLRRIIKREERKDNEEVISCGDLVIDHSKCEVSILGTLIPLTFREYELLRFLASHKGRVFSREALLNQVWGYDYYGGDRTVDVHIRRLRSKIEDSTHIFIDTVRNIGYRFRDGSYVS